MILCPYFAFPSVLETLLGPKLFQNSFLRGLQHDTGGRQKCALLAEALVSHQNTSPPEPINGH